MMRMEIFFHDVQSGKIMLKKGERTIDQAGFCLERNLEEVLIQSIDKIFERNKMNLFTLKTVELSGKLDRQGLAYQLASAFKKALIL